MNTLLTSAAHRPALAALAACLLATALPATAQIKRWVDERGVVHYSDALPTRTVPVTQAASTATDPPPSPAAQAAVDAPPA